MSNKEQNSTENPKILFDILWNFCRKIYKSKKPFDQAIKKYQVKITGKDTWNSGKVVIEKPEIEIFFDRDWEYPPDDKIEFTLQSENAKNFTALDLMFQLNNKIAAYDLGDFCFFEGLKYDSKLKKYVLHLGS